MRPLKRNQQSIWVSLFLPDEVVVDEDGNEYKGVYTLPFEIEKNSPNGICVSATKLVGDSGEEYFGKDVDYDRNMTTCDMTCQIDDYSLLWIDVVPVFNEDGSTDTPHDYDVKGVNKTQVGNVIVYAINRVS